MTYQNPAFKITILTPVDMQLYADGELSGNDKELAEGALLDDERARQLVLNSDGPSTSDPTSKCTELLNACVWACEKAVVAYESISRSAQTETIRRFAGNQFSERWKLLSDITSFTSTDDTSTRIIECKNSKNTLTTETLQQAERDDLALEKALQSAFDSPAPPKWKAKIAEWLAALRYERDRIAWIS